MARTPKDVTDAELAILELLWQRGTATVRELSEGLYPDAEVPQMATVQKLCERLLAKKYLARNARVRPAKFRAVVDRSKLIGRQLKSVADKLCAGSLSPLLTHLVESGDLNSDDLRQLREQVERLDKKRGTS